MGEYVFPVTLPSVVVHGTAARYAVQRIFCVGQNYAAHAREMGGDPHREPPFFFMKPASALVADGALVPYPSRTTNFHHEVELVAAIGRPGQDIAVADALTHVYGYAVGNDYTRRDLQTAARTNGRPWDISKGFDHSAGVGTLYPVAAAGPVERASLWLTVNGQTRQRAAIADMIWDVAGIVSLLSSYFALLPGDVIFTGTPAGVGPLLVGDVVSAGIDGLGTLTHTIVSG